MSIVFWIVGVAISLYILNVAFYRLKGVDTFQQPAQFPRAGKGFDGNKEVTDQYLSEVETKWFEVEGGKIECWLLADTEKRSTIIFAHGNTGYIDTNLAFAREIQACGYHVLLVEYPGYGRSTGKPSEDTITDGFVQAFDWLKSLSKVGKIGAYGNSLGSSAVARLTKERTLDLLILKSGIASFGRLIAKKAHVPESLVVNAFNTLGHIHLFKKPVLILHGKNDDIAVYQNALDIDAVALNSELVSFEGGHDSPNNEETLAQLQVFFGKNNF